VGSSFVDFHGDGFWVQDGSLEIWLALLVETIDRIPEPPRWLLELREQWHIATMGFIGCVPTDLDRHITTAERKAMVLSLSEQALHHLRTYGTSISAAELNRLNAAHAGSYWTRDVPITFFTDVGEHFMRLLRGELPPASGPTTVLP
jgi:hypothetical protein